MEKPVPADEWTQSFSMITDRDWLCVHLQRVQRCSRGGEDHNRGKERDLGSSFRSALSHENKARAYSSQDSEMQCNIVQHRAGCALLVGCHGGFQSW